MSTVVYKLNQPRTIIASVLLATVGIGTMHGAAQAQSNGRIGKTGNAKPATVWMSNADMEPSHVKGQKKPLPYGRIQSKVAHTVVTQITADRVWVRVDSFTMHRTDPRYSDIYTWEFSPGTFGPPTQSDQQNIAWKLGQIDQTKFPLTGYVKAHGRPDKNWGKIQVVFHMPYENRVPGKILDTYYKYLVPVNQDPSPAAVTIDSLTVIKADLEPAPRYIQIGSKAAQYVLSAGASGGAYFIFPELPVAAAFFGIISGAIGIGTGPPPPGQPIEAGTSEALFRRSVTASDANDPKRNYSSGVTSDKILKNNESFQFYKRHSILYRIGARLQYQKQEFTADHYGENGYIGPVQGLDAGPSNPPEVMGFYTFDGIAHGG